LLRLIAFLLLFEVVVRVEPISSILSNKLDSYENLLWYSDLMPVYKDELQNGPHYNIWLAGSSYMMTGLQPKWVESELRKHKIERLTIQNYGMTDMRNLYNMADLYDRWMFRIDKPQYLVIGVSMINFFASSKLEAAVTRSPIESTFIFPNSLDDYISGWFFRNSHLYRYTLLLRNATIIPKVETELSNKPLGGYIEGTTPFQDCNPNSWIPANLPENSYTNLFRDNFKVFEPIDYFIDTASKHNIPVAVVDIPIQFCNMRRYFITFDEYKEYYMNQLDNHLKQKGIPFLELSYRFYSDVPQDEQFQYYMDYHHPNNAGAQLFSQWTGDFISDWITQLQ
jgi:hypothetical protein